MAYAAILTDSLHVKTCFSGKSQFSLFAVQLGWDMPKKNLVAAGHEKGDHQLDSPFK